MEDHGQNHLLRVGRHRRLLRHHGGLLPYVVVFLALCGAWYLFQE